MGSRLSEIDLLTGHEPRIPWGETAAATEARSIERGPVRPTVGKGPTTRVSFCDPNANRIQVCEYDL